MPEQPNSGIVILVIQSQNLRDTRRIMGGQVALVGQEATVGAQACTCGLIARRVNVSTCSL